MENTINVFPFPAVEEFDLRMEVLFADAVGEL